MFALVLLSNVHMNKTVYPPQGFCPPERLQILLVMMFALLYFFQGATGLRTKKKLEQIISSGIPKQNCNVKASSQIGRNIPIHISVQAFKLLY